MIEEPTVSEHHHGGTATASRDELPPISRISHDDQQWLLRISDPTIHAQRIHELFMATFFGGGADAMADPSSSESEKHASDDDEAALLGVATTASDGGTLDVEARAREVARQQAARQELAELTGAAAAAEGSDVDEEDDDDILSRITEAEMAEREEERRRELEEGGSGTARFATWLGQDDEEDEEEGRAETTMEPQDLFGEEEPSAHAEPSTTAPRTAATATRRSDDRQKRVQEEIELELGKVGLGSNAAALATSRLPERFQVIAATERRPQLGSHRTATGTRIKVDPDAEAFWILRQLVKPGKSLHGNEVLVADLVDAASNPAPFLRDKRVQCVKTVVRLMTKCHLEPAHIMLYHRSETMPLLDMLWHSNAMRDYRSHLVNPSYAVCSRTGRRLEPLYLSDPELYIGFERVITREKKVIGSGDKTWGNPQEGINNSMNQVAMRKPCVIEVGRLCWEILELDGMCHTIERQRQVALQRLKVIASADPTGPRLANSLSDVVDAIAFDLPMDAELWLACTAKLLHNVAATVQLKQEGERRRRESQSSLIDLSGEEAVRSSSSVFSVPESLTQLHLNNPLSNSTQHSFMSRSATVKLQRLGFTDATQLLSAYAVDPYQVQEVLLGAPGIPNLSGLTFKVSLSPQQWAETQQRAVHSEQQNGGMLGRTAPLLQEADKFLELCRLAFIETAASLPVLLKAAYQAFVQQGYCVVKPINGMVTTTNSNRSYGGGARRVPIRTLLYSNPLALLPILEEEAQHHLSVELTCDLQAIRAALRFDDVILKPSLCHGPNLTAWEFEVSKLSVPLCRALAVNVKRHVRIALRQALHEATIRRSVSSFSALCQEGPWEPVKLTLEAYQESMATWDDQWNVVESLPTSLGTFAFPGNTSQRKGNIPVCGVSRDASGRTHFAFIDEFGSLRGYCVWQEFTAQSPQAKAEVDNQRREFRLIVERVIPEVIAIAASGRECCDLFTTIQRIVREDVKPGITTDIAVVWASPALARTMIQCQSVMREQTLSNESRMAACVARSVQEPLYCLARSLQREDEALRLPLGATLLSTERPSSKAALFTSLQRELTLWMTAEGIDINRVLALPSPDEILSFVAGLGPNKARRLVSHIEHSGGIVQSRTHLHALVADSVGGGCEAVAINCVSALRVRFDDRSLAGSSGPEGSWWRADANRSSSSSSTSFPWTPLDETMVPLCWYQVASRIAHRCVNHALGSTSSVAAFIYGLSDYRDRMSLADKELSDNVLTEIRNQFEDDVKDARRLSNTKVVEEDDDDQDLLVTLLSHPPLTVAGATVAMGAAASATTDSQGRTTAPNAQRYSLTTTPGRGKSSLLSDYRLAAQRAERWHLTRLGSAELEFVIDELCHFFEPHMRRHFRLMTSKRLFKCLTGITYISKRQVEGESVVPLAQQQAEYRGAGNVGTSFSFGSHVVVREGDLLECTIRQLLASDMVKGLKLDTTLGASAFLDIRDVPNTVIREAIDKAVTDRLDLRMQRQNAAADGTAFPVGFVVPPLPACIQPGTRMYATVTGVSHAKGELRVQWTQALPGAMRHAGGGGATGGSFATALANRTATGAADGAAWQRDGRSDAMSQSLDGADTVKTELYTRAVTPRIVAASTHVLYRDFSRHHAEKALSQGSFGAIMFIAGKPSAMQSSSFASQQQTWLNSVIALQKIGERSVADYHLDEYRESNGAVRYRLSIGTEGGGPDDDATYAHFSDLDHFIATYLAPLAQLVLQLRDHEAFEPVHGQLSSRLRAELSAEPRKPAFAFGETDPDVAPDERHNAARGIFYYLYFHMRHEQKMHKLPILFRGGGSTTSGTGAAPTLRRGAYFLAATNGSGRSGAATYEETRDPNELFKSLSRAVFKMYEGARKSSRQAS